MPESDRHTPLPVTTDLLHRMLRPNNTGAAIRAQVHSSLAAHSAQKGRLSMNRYDLLLATIAVVLVAGCASVTTQTAEPERDKTVVTGSRLPAREGAGAADVKAIGTKEGIDDMMKRGSIIIPSKGGGM
jgi:hypothetical protein